tara:strand:+ start:4647 stop:5099 length:453 start_codon:yes stop_codon:yes gene_type:complete
MSATPIVISPPPPQEGQLQDYSVDQAAGAVVLVLGAVASLLLVIWQSKCHCKINLCYLFQCERRPPNEEELKGLKDKAKELADKAKKDNKKPPSEAGGLPPAPTKPLLSEAPATPNPRSPTASAGGAAAQPQSQSPEPEPEAISSSWKKL